MGAETTAIAARVSGACQCGSQAQPRRFRTKWGLRTFFSQRPRQGYLRHASAALFGNFFNAGASMSGGDPSSRRW